MPAIVKVYTTVASKLSQLTVKDGQLIFVSDTRRIYLDFSGNRICYDTILNFDKDSDRTSLMAPVEGFYFVKETNTLWNYGVSGWNQLTSDNPNPIFFGNEVSDFPTQGNSKTLYVANDATYRYNSITSSYDMIANKTEWNTL